MKKLHIVVVGNDLAGIQCMQEIIKIHPNKYEWSFFELGSEVHQRAIRGNLMDLIPLVNRTLVNMTNTYRSESVTNIDTDNQWIYTDKKNRYQYDRLILSTGALTGVSQIPGKNKKVPIQYHSVIRMPNVQLAINSGIPVNEGIIVNGYMETAIPNIFALGECAEHRNQIDRLFENIQDQVKVLAQRICGVVCNPYCGNSPDFLGFQM